MWMLVANEANLASKSGYLAPRAAILADVTGANKCAAAAGAGRQGANCCAPCCTLHVQVQGCTRRLRSRPGTLTALLSHIPWLARPRSDLETDAKVVLAGAILMSIFNFILIGYWGLTEHAVNGITLSKSTEASGEAEGRVPGCRGAP